MTVPISTRLSGHRRGLSSRLPIGNDIARDRRNDRRRGEPSVNYTKSGDERHRKIDPDDSSHGAADREREDPHPPEVLAGIPSQLLERRPDIRQSELVLIAANAPIGVARAAYYPQIFLTGAGGFQSDALARLFAGSAGLWSFAGSLTQPVFTAGKIRSGVRHAEAQQQGAVLTYQQTIQQSFREGSDALIGYRKLREFREQQELLTASAPGAARLSNIRYKGGETSYHEVLTNETNYFIAGLNLAQAQANELLALVQLYQALGGGWHQ